MTRRKNYLTDYDKIFVTVALWIALIPLFTTALTLPMLPDKVAMFKPVDTEAVFYSKYNNLFTIMLSFIPVGIIIIAAALKKRNHMQRNFLSIMMFSIVLSTTMSALTMYGIAEQFGVTKPVKSMDDHTMIALTASLILSMLGSIMPLIVHSRTFAATAAHRSLKTTCFFNATDNYWTVGAYGMLGIGIICSICPGAYAYIPLGIGLVAVITCYCIIGYLEMKHRLEAVLYDALD